MHDPLLMGMSQAQGRLPNRIASVGDFQSPIAVNDVGQIQSIHKFRHQKMQPIEIAGIRGLHDVRMIQPTNRRGLMAKTLAHFRVVEQAGRDEFDRDGSTEPQVRGAMHGSHAARADLLTDLIRQKRNRHRRRTRLPSSGGTR